LIPALRVTPMGDKNTTPFLEIAFFGWFSVVQIMDSFSNLIQHLWSST